MGTEFHFHTSRCARRPARTPPAVNNTGTTDDLLAADVSTTSTTCQFNESDRCTWPHGTDDPIEDMNCLLRRSTSRWPSAGADVELRAPLVARSLQRDRSRLYYTHGVLN